jgi:precorrin-6A/cobalt-precorrin-6A reductase
MMVSHGSDMKVLVLGGTTEGAALARALVGMDALVALAGRTAQPADLPLPVRVGGFGGASAMAEFLRKQGFTHVIDATHPFAARISANAVQACDIADVPLIAVVRPPWVADAGDQWVHVPDIPSAAQALPGQASDVFLAIGRQELAHFAGLPHRWLLRMVDASPYPPLPDATVVVAKGPFTMDGDLALLAEHGIDIVVSKNAGGTGARAKIDAARSLGLPVIMVDRPDLSPRQTVATVEQALHWLHGADLGA